VIGYRENAATSILPPTHKCHDFESAFSLVKVILGFFTSRSSILFYQGHSMLRKNFLKIAGFNEVYQHRFSSA